MALPKAVQDQIDKAEMIHKEAYGEGAPPPAGDEPPPAAPPPADPNQPPAPPAAPPEQPPPAAPPEPPPAGDTVPRAAYEELKVQFDKLQASYSTLAGKYNAEPGRLAAELSASQREAQALREENARLKAGIAPPQTGTTGAPPPAPGSSPNAFSEWFEETYGSEHRAEFDAYVQSKIKETMGDVATRLDQVASATEQTAKERYYGALDAAEKNWEAIYRDPRFAVMLREEEGNTGRPKAEFAQKWENEMNADRVLPYIKEFKDRYGDPVPVPGSPAPAPPPPGAPPKDKSNYVAPRSTPGGSGGPSPRPEDNIPWVKASEIKRIAQEAATTRKWVGKEKELAAIRAQHNAAIAANRVLAGQ